jgi:hypothetical protein
MCAPTTYSLVFNSWKAENLEFWDLLGKMNVQKIQINRKLLVATFLTSDRAAKKVKMIIQFPIDRIPSCLIFEFWDFGRIMAVGYWAKSQNQDFWVFS